LNHACIILFIYVIVYIYTLYTILYIHIMMYIIIIVILELLKMAYFPQDLLKEVLRRAT